jgi:alpha-glucosidase
MLFPGAPGIYYGDEVGVDGGEDPECRATFPWDGDPTGHPVHRLIRDLAKLRREHPVLRRGRFRPLSATQHAVAFERFDRSDRLVVAINRGRRRARFGIPVSEVLWASGKPGPRLEVDGPGVVVARLA